MRGSVAKGKTGYCTHVQQHDSDQAVSTFCSMRGREHRRSAVMSGDTLSGGYICVPHYLGEVTEVCGVADLPHPPGGCHNPRDEVEESGLAGTVLADNTQPLACNGGDER